MTSTDKIISAISQIIIMLGMGLSLVPLGFKRALTYPKTVVIGHACAIIPYPITVSGANNSNKN